MTDAAAGPGHGDQLGGGSPIHIHMRAGRDVVGAFGPLADAIAKHTSGAIEALVTVVPSAPIHRLLAELESAQHQDDTPAIVVLSLADDIDVWTANPTASGAASAAEWHQAARTVCRLLKAAGARVFICNACTIDPDDRCSNFRGCMETPSVYAN